MSEARRLRASRPESGRTEVIRVDGGCVVATETMGDGGVPWITLTRFDDPIDASDETHPLPKKP
jgi:hypothetical protein